MNIYCLIFVRIWFVINNDSQQKMQIKIQNYSVTAYGLCNLICGYRVLIRELLPVKRGPECSSRTFINMYQTTRCPNPDHIMNPYQSEHLTSSTTKY